MVLFQGNVDSNKYCTDMKTNNATSCIALCIRNESCLLTLMTEERCFHCNYGKVLTITRYDSNHYIGLKISFGLSTLVKNAIPGSVLPFISPDHSLNSFSYNNNNTCTIGKFELKKCENGWEMFRRGSIWQCLRVLYSNEQMTQAEGKQNCRNVSAQLSGLESRNETRFVAENAEVEMRADNTLRGKSDKNGWAVWIDGERRPGCTEQAVINSTAECQGVQGFNFTDTTLTAKLGYDWSENEPNGYLNNQSCVVMMLNTNSTDKRHRKLDDTSCIDTASFLKRGVLCGMLAK
ncbi:hypothetical protein CRE_06574 [Caenorhabditis remanei]|uniref:Uncharacterized protein n=1 Tax=Caenorhabditis remanei TaxID=31234 RepID=E3M1L8_CAERE|nr:hypothetical protein CRE_06574 [Caenorhabditis remanei]